MDSASRANGNDLGAMFDAHVGHEFIDMDVDATMRTMTDDPYVFHVPTMTGGTGRDGVRDFYGTHFIGRWPRDTQVTPVSRTVGEDRVADELVVAFTHDREVPVILPGVPPTGRRIELPHVVVMGFEDGLVAYEHIYWDQAAALWQAGLIDGAGLPGEGLQQAAALLRQMDAPGTPSGDPGERHDLGSIFDRLVELTFGERDPRAATAMMHPEAYVWSVPTAAGARGRDAIVRHYDEDVAGAAAPAIGWQTISRTVGTDQVAGEILLTFTHDRPLGFALPGVEPTGRAIALPLVMVAGMAGGLVRHVHLTWDHGSLLVQAGLLDRADLPVLGDDAARWLHDHTAPLNRLLAG